MTEGVDIHRGSCGNIGQNNLGASVTGASSAYASGVTAMTALTAKDIARRYGKSERSARRDLADAISAGVPEVAVVTAGRGRPPRAVDESAYMAWRFGGAVASAA